MHNKLNLRVLNSTLSLSEYTDEQLKEQELLTKYLCGADWIGACRGRGVAASATSGVRLVE